MIWTNLFLYLIIISVCVIIVLIVLIGIRTNKYIKSVNKDSRDRIVDYIRRTSKYNKEERKRLKF